MLCVKLVSYATILIKGANYFFNIPVFWALMEHIYLLTILDLNCPLNQLFLYSMEVTPQLIDQLAHLSRLYFSDEEKASVQQDLQKMVAFVEQLNKVDTTGVEPLLHMGGAVNVLREDEVKQTITREEALSNAPDANDQYFRVPTVIKK
jgi:aspartyl-tRNA(Asn)/glutamyl-tRNA(Gln) amidotransferase subunit C